MTGFVHSVETWGTVDGPGIRYVVFLQGCPLRCKFCHNPDTWECNTGKKTEAQELVEDILKYKSFIKSGGVTLTGGEPLMQSAFVAEVFLLCHENGIHTALDTSGAIPLKACQKAVDESDLILLDIKHIDSQACKELTGQGNENALALLEYCEKIGKEVWIRHVIIPGITGDNDSIEKLGAYLSGFKVVSRVEVLPFHKLGEFKWKQLGINYSLTDIPEPSPDAIAAIRQKLKSYGLQLVY